MWNAFRSAADGLGQAIREAQHVTNDMFDAVQAPHRRKVFQFIADHFEMLYFPDGGDTWQQWYTRFPLFQTGGKGVYANLLQGKYLNTPIRMFDFLPAGKSAGWRTVIVIKLHHSRVPLFALWPHDRTEGDTRFLGRHHAQVNLPANSTFAANYQLHASNVDAVIPLFNRNARQYFASNKGWSIEAGGEWIMFYHHDRKCKAQDIRGFLGEGSKAFRTFNLK